MTWVTTGNFDTENAKRNKSPCIIVQFEEKAGATDDKYSSNVFADIDQYYKKYIKDFEYWSPAWNPGDTMLSMEKCTFTLIDKNNEILSLLSNNIIRRKNVTIKFGYAALNIADFITLPVFIVTKIDIADNGLDHIFTCESNDEIMNKLRNENIYTTYPDTYIDEDIITNAELDIDVGDASNFFQKSAQPEGLEASMIIGNKEIIKIGTIVGNTINSDGVLGKGQQGTAPGTHRQGDPVRQTYRFKETPGQIILHLMESTSGGTNGRYDLGIDGIGVGINDANIDVEQIEIESWRFYAAWENEGLVPVTGTYNENIRFYIIKEQKLSDVIKDLLEPINGILFKDSDNKLKLKILDMPRLIEDIGSETLNQNEFSINSIESLDEELINNIEHNYEYFPTKNLFNTKTNEQADNIVTAYTKYPENIINNFGMVEATGLYNTNDISHSNTRKYLFFGNILNKVNINVLPKKLLYEALDEIKISQDKYPNYDSNNRIWTNQIAIVSSKHIAVSQGTMNVDYDLILLNIINKASGLYTLDTFLDSEESFDDNSLTYDSDWTTTVQAADAYWDPSAEMDGSEYFYAKLNITLPASGSPAEQWIDIGMMIIDLGTPDVIEGRNTTRIRYNSGESSRTVWINCLVPGRTGEVERVKLDYYNRSTSTGGQLPTAISWDELWAVKRNYTIS